MVYILRGERKKDEINDDLSGKMFLKSSHSVKEREETPLVVEMSCDAKRKVEGNTH